MVKPRIIIADTDINYIIPLQLRFVEEFFEKVEIEIITDREYFLKMFSAPQKAEILIVSEDLYDLSLQKHNIGNIFLMTERYEDDQTGDLNITRIYKYTSIKEIFNEISGSSASVIKVNYNSKKETEIIVVYSAAGGVGKTTVALGLAACLTQNYKRVLYINASWLQSFQRMLGNPSPISAIDIYSMLSNPSQTVYTDIKHAIRKELFSYLPPFKASLMSLGLSYSVFEKIAVSAKRTNDFDFIIVDADSEFDEEKASLLGVADKVVVVTKQNASSVFATNTLVTNMNGATSEKYIFVCNDFVSDEDNELISSVNSPRFTVSEYIEHISHYDSLKVDGIASNNGMKKASFLIL